MNISCGLCYTFEDWCKDNNHQDYLDLWNYELNEKKPSEVRYDTNCNYYMNVENQPRLMSLKFLYNKGICVDKNSINSNQTSGIKDGIKYPNKFIASLVSQLGIGFINEMKFSWSDKFEYDGINYNRKVYDLFIPHLNCIIENHGLQHYNNVILWRSLEEEQENDRLKRELALNNGIEHYIELDCRKSEMEWIKQSVMDSEIPDLLGFKEEDIDWLKCHEYALKNLAKETCELWNSGINNTLEISTKLNIARGTVIRWLKQCNECGMCDYNPTRAIIDGNKKGCKEVAVYKDGILIGIYESAAWIEKNSTNIFKEKLLHGNISRVCTGKIAQYKGYTFEYTG